MSSNDPPGPLDAPPSAFVAAAALEITKTQPDRVEGFVDLGARHHTPWGVVHGGVYTSAIESAASIGASTAVAAKGQFAVGVNNTTNFIRAMTTGTVDVVAEPIQQGQVQQLWEVRITGRDDGALVAQGLVRLQNVRRRRGRSADA
jgi:1,4-dihydroxy-2-naphthoyl-CoA hydrolase